MKIPKSRLADNFFLSAKSTVVSSQFDFGKCSFHLCSLELLKLDGRQFGNLCNDSFLVRHFDFVVSCRRNLTKSRSICFLHYTLLTFENEKSGEKVPGPCTYSTVQINLNTKYITAVFSTANEFTVSSP